VNIRRMPRLLSLVAGAVASLVAYGAEGQEPDPNVPVTSRARPDYDPLGIRAGGFLIYPSVSVGATYDDNVFATNNNEQDDFIFTVSPRIAARSNFPRHSLELTVGSDIGRYVDQTNENFEDYGADLGGVLDITRNNRLVGGAFYEHGHTSRDDPEDPGVEVDPDEPDVQVSEEPLEFNDYGGNLGFEQDFNRFNFSVLGDVERRDYDDDTEAGRDRLLYGGTLRTGYFISPRINAFLQGGYRREERDTSEGSDPPIKRDNNVYDARIGTEIDITGLLFGEVSVGWSVQDFDESDLDTENGFVYGTGLTWNPTQLTSLTLDGSGGFEPSDVGTSKLTNRIALRVDHELLRNVLIGGEVGFRREDFQDTGRVDNRFDVGPDITYLLNRYLSVGAGYTFTTQTSDDNEEEFTRNLFTLRLTAQL
jgi:hypothetical protein